MATIPDVAVQALLARPGILARKVAGVWVFGSHAHGTPSSTSDVDLAVLCEPPLGNDRFRLIEELETDICCPVDLIDLNSAAATLAWEVVTTGRLMREFDAERVEHFVRHARFRAEDDEQKNRMILLAHTSNLGGRTRQ